MRSETRTKPPQQAETSFVSVSKWRIPAVALSLRLFLPSASPSPSLILKQRLHTTSSLFTHLTATAAATPFFLSLPAPSPPSPSPSPPFLSFSPLPSSPPLCLLALHQQLLFIFMRHLLLPADLPADVPLIWQRELPPGTPPRIPSPKFRKWRRAFLRRNWSMERQLGVFFFLVAGGKV